MRSIFVQSACGARPVCLLYVPTSVALPVFPVGGPDGRWVDITTDIRYSDEAEAVAQSVFESDSGQTAGRLRTVGSVEDAKLGPVGTRGRIVLTYSCKSLYTYAQVQTNH